MVFVAKDIVGLQWRQQLDIFSNALQTGQLDVQAFGLEFLVCTVFVAQLVHFSPHVWAFTAC